MNWTVSIQKTLDFIEENLTETLNDETISTTVGVSFVPLQRYFALLTGLSLSEYIRQRRMTAAAADLKKGDKVIDTALRYGYDSPDSFARAFQRFHGLPPSAVHENGVRLNARSPLHIKLILEGGNMLDYKIVHQPALTLLGFHRRFEGVPYGENRDQQEEALFTQTRAKQWMLRGMAGCAQTPVIEYVVMNGFDAEGYTCWYATEPDRYSLENLYNPQVTGIDFMERFGFETLPIPECSYVVFRTPHMKHPVEEYLRLRRQIAAEWMPGTGYSLNNDFEMAVYHWAPKQEAEKRFIEIRLPLA